MSAKRVAKKRTNWVLRLVLVACAVFLFLKLVQLHMQMSEKQQQITDLQDSIHKQSLLVEDLGEQIANADDYLERHANENGLVLPGQQIYQSSAG